MFFKCLVTAYLVAAGVAAPPPSYGSYGPLPNIAWNDERRLSKISGSNYVPLASGKGGGKTGSSGGLGDLAGKFGGGG